MTPLPSAARQSLLNKRLMDHQGVTRTARLRHCRRCGLAVLAGIDNLGMTVACWPMAITHRGELSALLAGLRTFYLDGDRLISRWHLNIGRISPDEHDVHIQHRCGDPVPETNPLRVKKPLERKGDDYGPPPF